jgi:predicted amidohydrolase YtcJ
MLVRGEIGPTALDDPRATKASLDKLAPDHPVMLDTWSQHAAILNTAGLTKLGVSDNEPDPLGGRFVRSADGKLNGVVYEYAKFRLNRSRSDMATDQEALRQTQDFSLRPYGSVSPRCRTCLYRRDRSAANFCLKRRLLRYECE